MHRRVLYLMLALFAITGILMIWFFVYKLSTTFQAGTRPADVAEEPLPTMPELRSSDPDRGSKDKDAVTIVEFADYACVHCRAEENELKTVLSENPKVRHVWRDMPLASDRPDNMLSALTGRCAKDQGRFWEMYERLMIANRYTIESVRGEAKELGLDMKTFNECLASQKKASEIQTDIQEARNHGLTSAPTFFIFAKGEPLTLVGYQSAAELRWAILKASWAK